jgi:hypothetical protein
MEAWINVPLLPIEAVKVMVISAIVWVYALIIFGMVRSTIEIIFTKQVEPVKVEKDERRPQRKD